MIECQDVSFSYPASTLPDSERQAGGALKHISCTIEDGSFVLLCGTSGCGKTTMTRLFNGLIPHYHEGTYTGSVYLDGKDTRDLSLFDISLKVGSVFQNPRSQFFNVDTTSELAFGPENHGIAEDLVRDRVKRVAAQLKLEPLLDRSIFSLSGGEKQKIACGSAAAIDPDIYVLDEPSSNLDAYAIADFRQLLFTLKSQGKTVIISEHRLYYLSGLFDRVLYLKDGEIEGDYTAEEFCGLSARQRDDMGLRPLDLAGLSEVEGPPQRMNEAVWTIKNVSFAYKHEPETLHIAETSFPSGSATAIIGHNGAGKSTFARCLCGLEKHFKGTVQDQSKNYSRKERLKLCYMVMQDVNHQLFTESVLDEILLSMRTEDMSRKNRSPEEKARRAKIRELLQMANIDSMDDIQNLFKETIAEFMENGLEAELDEDLGYSKYDYKNKATDNSRNGHSSKNLRTSFGDVEVSVPRDRKGEFEPQLLKKNQTSISQDIEEKILSMYAKGMTTGDIEAHIQDIYGLSVSDTTVSRITNKILPVAKEWQQRPLESIYAVVFLDAIHYHVRSEGQIVKKAVYIAIGLDLDGRKDILGMWVGENESAKFWATVLNGLRNRGVEDIFIACTDNLTSFDTAIHAVFPETEIQNCMIHQLRNSSKYVSYKDLKALMSDLKAVYAAVDEQAALDALETFAQNWDNKYPKIAKSWRENWANLST